jgi:hypothetical protein
MVFVAYLVMLLAPALVDKTTWTIANDVGVFWSNDGWVN